MSFHPFIDSLRKGDPIETIASGVIGHDRQINTPFGTKPLIYADYVATGRALRQVEHFLLDHVLPDYGNTHTAGSHCGRAMNALRAEARRVIAEAVNAGPDSYVVFTGSGATSAVNRLVGLLDLPRRISDDARVIVLIGPYEHHSNILPWRESGAEVVEVLEAANGGVDLADLEQRLSEAKGADLVVGSFSAASNVTGCLTDTDAVTAMLKSHGALSFWDYACGAPYLPMDMGPPGGPAKDGLFFSAHKFVGGAGASGVLVVRETAVARATPTAPGGGTVRYVSPSRHLYVSALVEREEAGTPNILGDIRAALAMIVRDHVGCDVIARRNAALRARALAAWRDHPQLRLLGQLDSDGQLPIFAFLLSDSAGRPVGHTRFSQLLSDRHGIQARAGCSCAGPYGHRLLKLDAAVSDRMYEDMRAGRPVAMPGWVRLNFSYLLSDENADTIIEGVLETVCNLDLPSVGHRHAAS